MTWPGPAQWIRSLRNWPKLRRASRPLRAGDSITTPSGTHTLTKDWQHLTVQDLADIGIFPGENPSLFVPDQR